MTEKQEFPAWLSALRERLGFTRQKMAEETGLTVNYLYQLERGAREPSDSARKLFELIAWAHSVREPVEIPIQQVSNAIPGVRMVPLLGMAHAGEAVSYEEMACEAEDHLPAATKDPDAFMLRIKGESMVPDCYSDDLVLVEPNRQLYSNCMAVLRLDDDGVVLRRIEVRPDFIRLIPSNPRYTVEEMPRERIRWVYYVRRLIRDF